MPGPQFTAKWPREKCPTCSEPWAVGDMLAYNDDNVVVHAQCAYEVTQTMKSVGAKEYLCSKCNLIHSYTYDCEE